MKNPFDAAMAGAFGTPILAALMERYQSLVVPTPARR